MFGARRAVTGTSPAPICRGVCPEGVGPSAEFCKQAFIRGYTFFDGGLLSFTERNLLQESQQVLLAYPWLKKYRASFSARA
jgi:hypothetical protein